MPDADAVEAALEWSVVPAGRRSYEENKQAAAGAGGKFDEGRREVYLGWRRMGEPHMAAVRRAGISPATYDRYSAAVGAAWHQQVHDAIEESLDPVRSVQRRAALEREEPWAIQAELRKSRARIEEPSSVKESSAGAVNVGSINVLSVQGGAAGVDAALEAMLGRLKERAAVEAGADVGP